MNKEAKSRHTDVSNARQRKMKTEQGQKSRSETHHYPTYRSDLLEIVARSIARVPRIVILGIGAAIRTSIVRIRSVNRIRFK